MSSVSVGHTSQPLSPNFSNSCAPFSRKPESAQRTDPSVLGCPGWSQLVQTDCKPW